MESGDKHVQRLRKLTECILGPVNLRSPERPTRGLDGTYQGGTALERTDHANGVKGSRCYTTAYSYQNAPNITSTTADSKNTRKDDSLAIRREVNLVCGL
jgi:hypothetical protein